MDYEQQRGDISYTWPVGATTLCVRASRLRRIAGLLSGNLSIELGGQQLYFSYCHLERDEDRTRASRAAYARAPKGTLDERVLRQWLEQFCSGLEDASTAHLIPILVEGEESPVEFVIQPYILQDGGTILFAPPGRGKSYTGLLMAVSVDEGLTQLWQTTKLPVLFLNLERSERSLRRRLAAVNKSLGLLPQHPLRILNCRGVSLSAISDTVTRYIEKEHIGLVVVDSLSRGGFGDLNENRPANAMIDTMNSWDTAWLALGHTPYQTEEKLFGSIMFLAGADVEIQMLTSHKDGWMGLGLQVIKANDIECPPMQVLACQFENNVLAAVRKSSIGEFPQIAAARLMHLDEQIAELLKKGVMTTGEIAKELNKDASQISRILTSGEQFVLHSEGRVRYYGLRARDRE